MKPTELPNLNASVVMTPNNLRALVTCKRRLKLAHWLCAVLLIALVLSLSACATPSPPCPVSPLPMPRPALTEPLPSESYSLSVATNIKRWAQSLTGTPVMSKP